MFYLFKEFVCASIPKKTAAYIFRFWIYAVKIKWLNNNNNQVKQFVNESYMRCGKLSVAAFVLNKPCLISNERFTAKQSRIINTLEPFVDWL